MMKSSHTQCVCVCVSEYNVCIPESIKVPLAGAFHRNDIQKEMKVTRTQTNALVINTLCEKK